MELAPGLARFDLAAETGLAAQVDHELASGWVRLAGMFRDDGGA